MKSFEVTILSEETWQQDSLTPVPCRKCGDLLKLTQEPVKAEEIVKPKSMEQFRPFKGFER
jgi:hypothetical protein